jgi:Helix-turn-helix domain
MDDDKTDEKTKPSVAGEPVDHRPLVGFGLPPGPPATAPQPLVIPIASNEGAIDVAAIRAKTGLSQEAFAARYGFSKRTLQEWEQHRKRPTGAARSLLMVIRRHPKKVAKALQRDPLLNEAADADEGDAD